MFDDFSADDFHRYCEELAIFSHGSIDMKKANNSFSDGMKMKLMLAGVMARKTDLLLLDEPASPLDPLMRDKLCQMIGEYIHEGNGQRSVFSLRTISLIWKISPIMPLLWKTDRLWSRALLRI